jgi:hypothetical protein
MVVASPSKSDPNYYYDWVRDTALTYSALVDYYALKKDSKIFVCGGNNETFFTTTPQLLQFSSVETIVKIYAGYLIPEEAIAQKIKDHQQLHQKQLEIYQAIERNFFSSPQNCPKESRFAYLTLRRGINFEKGWLNWCEEALQLLADWA